MSDALAAMWDHPDLEEFFASAQRRTLSCALQDLEQFGQPVLAAHDDHSNGTRRCEWVCSVRLRLPDYAPIFAHGDSPELAALRCLMEAVLAVRRAATA